MHISDEGVVIRDAGRDEDRIITILTQKNGVLTAFAGKARRPRSSLASSTELLCHSRFEFFQNRDRTVVDSADSIHSFFGVRQSVEDLALGCWFAQLAHELAPPDGESGGYISLILSALYLLETHKRPRDLLKAAYELRLLTMAGYMPDLVGCSECGGLKTGGMYFCAEGFLLCGDCRGENHFEHAKPGIYPLSDGVLAAMRHAVYADLKKVFSFSLSDAGLGSLAKISEDFMLRQVEKTFPALEFYRTVR